MSTGKQQVVIEVSASAKPSEVVGAVLAGAQPRAPVSNPNKWIQIAFAFVVCFSIIVYFREEVWSYGRDVRPHKIMGYVEQIQIQHYLGSSWLFGSGKGDVTEEDAEVAKVVLNVTKAIASANSTRLL